MPSSYTPNFSLNQWAASDKVLRTDFNADNAKLDAAMNALSKRGRLEIIKVMKSNGESTGGGVYYAPEITWSDWDYVVALVHYSNLTVESTNTFSIYFHGDGPTLGILPLASPGYMIVFLPMHNGEANAAGFVIADRFIPFSCEFSYQSLREISFFIKGPNSIHASVAYFGAK